MVHNTHTSGLSLPPQLDLALLVPQLVDAVALALLAEKPQLPLLLLIPTPLLYRLLQLTVALDVRLAVTAQGLDESSLEQGAQLGGSFLHVGLGQVPGGGEVEAVLEFEVVETLEAAYFGQELLYLHVFITLQQPIELFHDLVRLFPVPQQEALDHRHRELAFGQGRAEVSGQLLVLEEAVAQLFDLVLVGQSDLIHLVDASGAKQGWVQSLFIVSGHDDDPAFLAAHSVDGVQETREGERIVLLDVSALAEDGIHVFDQDD